MVAQRERRAAQAEQGDHLLRLELAGKEEHRADCRLGETSRLLVPGMVESPVVALITIVVLVVAALSYALLCSIWMLRHVQTAMGV